MVSVTCIRRASGALLGSVLAVVGCGEQSALNPQAPVFAVAGAAACPIAPSVVVTNEQGLVAALVAAAPGQVIAVSGTIVVHSDLFITAPNVTLTCASPGAGLVADTFPPITFLLNARANGITVAYLVLDAHSLVEGPFDGGDASSLRFTNNRVTCGAGECVFFDENTPNAVVADNQFVANGTCTGVHLQLGIDGSRIERNTIVATAPSTCPNLGGIRARDGGGVTIANNVVLGPWINSLALVDLASSRVEQNRSQGSVSYGIRAGGRGSFLPISMTGDRFQGNVVTGAGAAGIFFHSACRNTFLGNALQGNAGDVGAFFDVMTGANVFDGNENVVIDNGSFDCDGDGQVDRNVISGPGRVLHVPQGPPSGDSTAVVGRLR
jgi:hypothetical protein